MAQSQKTTRDKLPLGRFYVLVFLFFAILLGGLALMKIYQANYDSSLNGSEIKEEQQNTIPPEVMDFLKGEEKLHLQPPVVTQPTSFRVPILMYHYVEYVKDKGDKTRISLDTAPATLEQEVKTLVDAGYNFMTAEELAAVLDGQAQLPPKPILLTFDDGYRDFYTDAYPILKKYHIKATQYVISGFLNNENHLTVAQLREIAKDDLVEIGAHTVHHIWLKGQSPKRASDEVLQSKLALEKLIGKRVVSFAYPFGAFDRQAIEVVQNAGFTNAVSTVAGVNQQWQYRYILYRLRPGGRSGNGLLQWLDLLK